MSKKAKSGAATPRAKTAIEDLSERWFTPESEKDKDESEQKQFFIAPLTGFDEGALVRQVIVEDGVFQLTDTGMETAIKKGLKDWKNVKDFEGNDAEFSLSNIDFLPGSEIVEIANEIATITYIRSVELKNY